MPYDQNQRLRVDVGFAPDDIVGLPDAQIEDAYERAGVIYTDTASVNASARVIVLEQLYAAAVTSTDYTQNSTQEKASQLFDHYGKLLDKWNAALDGAINLAAAGESGSVRSGRQTRKPARLKEFPGGTAGWGW
jgi:hypothetical protein